MSAFDGCSEAEYSVVVRCAQYRVVVLAAVEDAKDGELPCLIIDEGGDHRTLHVAGRAEPGTDVVPHRPAVGKYREALAVGHDGTHVIGSNRRGR